MGAWSSRVVGVDEGVVGVGEWTVGGCGGD